MMSVRSMRVKVFLAGPAYACSYEVHATVALWALVIISRLLLAMILESPVAGRWRSNAVLQIVAAF